KNVNRKVSLELSYKVPDTAPAGTFDSGLTFDVNTFGSTQTFNPIGVTIDVQGPASTATQLTVPATATVGVAVDLSASVSPAVAGGTVQFKDGDATIGAPANVVNGTATLSHAFSATGPRSITAVYSGVPGFTGSASAPSTVTVSAPDVATSTVLSLASDAQTGVQTRLVAAVTPAPAGGTVQFKEGDAPIGGPVSVVDGTATLWYTFNTPGDHPITAVYSGAPGFTGSTSAATTLKVTGENTGGGGSSQFGFGS
ncbi:Ig-like domain-containing protein, partial [Rhodococcus sp. NPDC058523]